MGPDKFGTEDAKMGKTYKVWVNYATPSPNDLWNTFDKVNCDYGGMKFEPINACRDILRTPREIRLHLVHLNRWITTFDAIAELDQQSLRPAIFEELFAFAVKHPGVRKKYLMTALGSVSRFPVLGVIRHFSPCLVPHGEYKRGYLDYNWINNGWRDNAYFLAIRK
jgi:hypothetical protein